MQLTELHLDAIAELLNIGMGQATDSLSQILNEEVNLSVPSVQLLSRVDAAKNIDSGKKEPIVAIKQHFEGPFWGDALLLFPQEKSLELVRAIVKEEVSHEMLLELEQDALSEIGNIILTSCLSSLANILTHEVTSSVPSFVSGPAIQVINDTGKDGGDVVMFLRMDFELHIKDIYGYVAFILEVAAVERFKESINKYIGLI